MPGVVDTPTPGPLACLRLLDLVTRIGAPFAATLLADLGAEVIKIELPGQGDFVRTISPYVDRYSLFWAVEGSKKSVRSICGSRRGGRC
jgi:crotonobetainyl-CoA:carnitine CoA-transferase CaiB-like acyl-CoA transferase